MTDCFADAVLASFKHLTPRTLVRIAEHLEYGGSPLTSWESKVAGRALCVAGNAEDAAALLYVASES